MPDRIWRRPTGPTPMLLVPRDRVILPSEYAFDEQAYRERPPTVVREFASLDEMEAFLDGDTEGKHV